MLGPPQLLIFPKMSKSLLQYRSEPILCGLTNKESFSGSIDEWDIRDEIKETDQVEKGIPLNKYQLIVEKEVRHMKTKEKQKEEFRFFRKDAFELIDELNLVWPLVFGSILSPAKTVHGSRSAPDHWSSNSKDLIKELHPSKYNIELSVDSRRWVILSYQPLCRLLKAHTAYRKASKPVRTLVKLYFDAIDSNRHASMFIFANALELVRAILPGNNDEKRTKALPQETREAIGKDLTWLFTIANNRLDVRHVVKKDPNDLKIHPKITENEISLFRGNASLIIKSVIEEKLGLSIEIPKMKN